MTSQKEEEKSPEKNTLPWPGPGFESMISVTRAMCSIQSAMSSFQT